MFPRLTRSSADCTKYRLLPMRLGQVHQFPGSLPIIELILITPVAVKHFRSQAMTCHHILLELDRQLIAANSPPRNEVATVQIAVGVTVDEDETQRRKPPR